MKAIWVIAVLTSIGQISSATGVDLDAYITAQNQKDGQSARLEVPREVTPSLSGLSPAVLRNEGLELNPFVSPNTMLVYYELSVNHQTKTENEDSFANRIFNHNMDILSQESHAAERHSVLEAAYNELEKSNGTNLRYLKAFFALISDAALKENNQRSTAFTKESLISAFKDFSSHRELVLTYFDIIRNYCRMLRENPEMKSTPEALGVAVEMHFLAQKTGDNDDTTLSIRENAKQKTERFLRRSGLISLDSQENFVTRRGRH